MGIISVENTDRLFWLGRYSERVYTTIKVFNRNFDSLLDMESNKLEEFCRQQEIPNIYTAEDFAMRYCFDAADPNSIFSNLHRAYDNAIVLREEIGSETLAYVQLAVYEMNKARKSESPLIQLMKVTDNIAAFWGVVDDSIDNDQIRNIIKVGKRVERIDLYARMRYGAAPLQREVKRLTGRIDLTRLKYDHARLMKLNYYVLLDELNYEEIIEAVENLV